MTAADVKFTLELVAHQRKSPSSMLRIELAEIAGVEDPNPLTVLVQLKRPSFLLPAVLAEVGILPAHLYKRRGVYNSALNEQPVGSGPYVRVEGGKDRIVLERHDGYWGERPAVAEVVFRAIADPARALAAVKNGEVDLLSSLYPGYYPEQVDPARLRGRLRLVRLHPYRLRVLLFNVKHAALRRPQVRLALTRLINRQRLVRRRRDLAKVLSAPLWPLGGSYDRGLHPRSYSRQEAERLLDAAGWPRGAGKKSLKVRTRLGHPLQLHLLRARHSSDGVAMDKLRAEGRAAGIDLRVVPADFGFLRAQLDRGRFELATLGLALRPGADLSPLLHSGGALNFGGYRNPEVDRLLEQIRGTREAAARHVLGRQLHRALYADPPMVVLYAPIELMVVSKRIRGIADDGSWPLLSRLKLAAPDLVPSPKTKTNTSQKKRTKGR